MKIRSVFVCIVALALAPLAQAQVPDASGQAERQDLALRYFRIMHMDTQMKRVADMVSSIMVDQVLSEQSKGSDADKSKASEIVRSVLAESLGDIEPQYEQAASGVIATTFTTEELRALVNFYESPVGESIISKQSQLAAPLSQAMKALLPQMKSAMRRHLCEKIGCGAAPSARDPS